jgi:hypothetical protein
MADKPIINRNFSLFRAAALLVDYPFKVTLAALNSVSKLLEPLAKVDFFGKTGEALMAVTGGAVAAVFSIFLPEVAKDGKGNAKKQTVYDEHGKKSEVTKTESGLLPAILSPLIGHNGALDNRNKRVHGLLQLPSLLRSSGKGTASTVGQAHSLAARDPYVTPPHSDGGPSEDSVGGYRGVYGIGGHSPRTFDEDPDSEFATPLTHAEREAQRRSEAVATRGRSEAA